MIRVSYLLTYITVLLLYSAGGAAVVVVHENEKEFTFTVGITKYGQIYVFAKDILIKFAGNLKLNLTLSFLFHEIFHFLRVNSETFQLCLQ